VSGDGQSAAAASALANPLVVRVLDSHGNGVAGVTVGWTVAAGGGAVSPASSTTDSTGAAQATLVLGPAPGLNTVTAQVDPSISVTFSATGTAPSLTLVPGFMEPGAFGPSARPARSGRPIL
ncbi:MAG: Ig-like domain-containing protein, partial [Gemmatimonadaceae bacterium]